jgi:uncharacterized OB-fold protein
MTAPDRPTTDTDSESWWVAVQDGTLTVNACRSCKQNSLYTRPFCPHCWSEEISAVPATGRATLYTWTITHQNGPPFDSRGPYVVAMVDLAEGPRLMTNIEGCPPEALEAGLQLILDFRHDEDGFAVPIFTPAQRQPKGK